MQVKVIDRDGVTVLEKDVAMGEGEEKALRDALATGDPEKVREALEEIDGERPDPDVMEVLDALDRAGDGAEVEAD